MGGGLVTKLCLTLCDPVDCSLPGSSVQEISQARILEWVAILFSWGSSQSCDQISSLVLQADSSPLSHQGSSHTGLDKPPKGSHLEGHPVSSSSILERLTELMNSSSKGVCCSLFLIVLKRLNLISKCEFWRTISLVGFRRQCIFLDYLQAHISQK